MGKTTISMTVFHRFLFVYQAGYVPRVAQVPSPLTAPGAVKCARRQRRGGAGGTRPGKATILDTLISGKP